MKSKMITTLTSANLLILSFFFLASSSAIAQKKDNQQFGEKVVIQSEILGEERVQTVFLPNNYEQTNQKYPVLYLLDGRAHYKHATAAVEYLSIRGIIPSMIVVAVHNVDRTRDFSPVADKRMPTSGGASKFLNFVDKELTKHIEDKYRTSNFTVLMGHSFGGTFATYAILTKPNLFDGYISVSPYLQYVDNHMVKEAQQKLLAKYKKQKFYYMTVGNELNYFEPLEKFSNLVKEKSGEAIKFKYEKLMDDNHGTTPYLSVFKGLKFIFSDWQLPMHKLAKGIGAMDEHYKKISAKYGYEIKTPENLINALGYNYLQNKDITNAIVVFKENVKRYPKSANVYDSLGEAYEQNNQLKLAGKNYEKAYNLGKETGDANAEIFKANFERVQQKL